MAAPIVSWYDRENQNPKVNYNIGTVDAGTVSPDTGMLIWNNRGGAVAVSKMESCTLTVKDSAGGVDSELVTDQWIEVKVDSLAEPSFSKIGYDSVNNQVVSKALQAGGAGAQEILGDINDGTKANSLANFAEITLHANVLATASAGNHLFLLRTSYQYV